MARLQEKYRTEIVAELKKELKTDNIHALPRLDKIVISMASARPSRTRTCSTRRRRISR